VAKRPAPDVDITEGLVRSLVRAQAPDLAERPLTMLSRGWDNTSYRLGTEHIVRLPHREAAEPLIVHEQRWLPTVAAMVELDVPTPVHCGVPTEDYHFHWSIVPWFEGHEAALAPLADEHATAGVLGRFFAQLHRPAPQDAPRNPVRGCPLADRASSFHTALARLAERPAVAARHDLARARTIFDRAAELSISPDLFWMHGDLHTRNLVVDRGELVAVIDWGDLAAGDPATDLAGAFMLVPGQIDRVAPLAGATEADWARARGWAVNFAVVYLANSDDEPVMYTIGERLLDTVLRTEPAS
jgi:aminoglycoside phosphotransferase (APT) family kinase protein